MATQTVLHSNDISCNHCAMTIKRELGALDGIVSVEVDVPAKDITLTLRDDAVLAKAKALLEEIGYPVS